MGYEISSFPNGVDIASVKSLFGIGYNDYYNISVNTPDANLNPWGFQAGLAAFRNAPYGADELKYYDHTYPKCSRTVTLSGEWSTYGGGMMSLDLSKLRSWMRNPTFNFNVFVSTSNANNFEAHNLGSVLNVAATGSYIHISVNPAGTANAIVITGGGGLYREGNLNQALSPDTNYYLIVQFVTGAEYFETALPAHPYSDNVLISQIALGHTGGGSGTPSLPFHLVNTSGSNLSVQAIRNSNGYVIGEVMTFAWYATSTDPENPIQSQSGGGQFDDYTPFIITTSSGGSTLPRIIGTGTVIVNASLRDFSDSNSMTFEIEDGQIVNVY